MIILTDMNKDSHMYIRIATIVTMKLEYQMTKTWIILEDMAFCPSFFLYIEQKFLQGNV